MNDIVERLREASKAIRARDGSLYAAAAVEIERLEAEIERIRGDLALILLRPPLASGQKEKKS